MDETAWLPSDKPHEAAPGWVWWSDPASRRNPAYGASATGACPAVPKHQNGAIFVNIEGLRSCLSKPSYRAPKWALMVRLMQKERLKSPQKSLILKN